MKYASHDKAFKTHTKQKMFKKHNKIINAAISML